MFLDMNLEAQQVKAKITQWDYTKLETYCIDQEATHCKGIAQGKKNISKLYTDIQNM